MKQRTFDDFDQFSRDYRQIHNQNIRLSGADSDYFSRYKVEEVARHEKPEEVKSILDFGCGDGNSIKHFITYFPQSHFFGADVSKESIFVAQARNLDRSQFSDFDGVTLPYQDNSFDIVFLAGVLHHVDRSLHSMMLDEIHRVLKPKGRLYIFEHNPHNPFTRKLVHDCVFDTNATLLPSRYLVKLLGDSNFGHTSKRYTIFFPRHRIFQPLILLEQYIHFIPLGGQYYVASIK